MPQDYKIFKQNTPIEITNQYFQQCVDEVKVYIVIKTRRKYARIDYDFITLDNAKQAVKDLSQCKISDKIQAYALQYAEAHKLSKDKMKIITGDKVGAFEFYIEDVEKVGNDISKIITDAVESDCIKYTTMEEMINKLSSEELKGFKRIYGEDFGK